METSSYLSYAAFPFARRFEWHAMNLMKDPDSDLLENLNLKLLFMQIG